jgi:acyl-phosphate glycerol 3-phosphate acyltransferase
MDWAAREQESVSFFLIALSAYLLGSLPSGYLIGRAQGIDIRAQGSGNIGATNTLRVLGKKWGYLCFVMDIGKGAVAVWLAKLWAGPALGIDPTNAAIVAAAGALLGHTFPVWLGFKGGKGIATSGGIAIALFPPIVFLVSIGAWIVVFQISRIVSVASLVAASMLGGTLVLLAALHRTPPVLAVIGVGMTLLAFWLHRSNLARLARGEEPRFERKRK